MYFLALFFLEIIVLFFLSRTVTSRLGKAVYKITKNKKWTVYIMSILFLPGTFIHEISHFLSALILLVPVKQMDLLPEIEEEKVVLGRVPIAKVDFVRRTLVGISPFVSGITIILGGLYYLISNSLLSTPIYIVLAAYLIFEIGNTMYLSKTDLEGTWIFFLLVFVVVIALYFLGVRLSLTPKLIEVFKKASIYLAIPIIIDLVILFAISLPGNIIRYGKN
jgi:hypothetical protein